MINVGIQSKKVDLEVLFFISTNVLQLAIGRSGNSIFKA
jgi:hypothetical protein